MDEKKRINEGYPPSKKGYQPTHRPAPTGGKVQGGYQPTKSAATPVKPPPKKP